MEVKKKGIRVSQRSTWEPIVRRRIARALWLVLVLVLAGEPLLLGNLRTSWSWLTWSVVWWGASASVLVILGILWRRLSTRPGLPFLCGSIGFVVLVEAIALLPMAI